MSDNVQTNPFGDPLANILRPYPALPAWLARRLLRADERVTWVRGPRLTPWWERYVTHPALFLVALALGAVCLETGRLRAGSWSELPALPILAAAGIVIGSIFVLGISAGYFTRLVVTNFRLVILQGYEVCRSWRIDALPPSLIFYGVQGDKGASRTLDLDALQTMLGGSSDQFVPAKTILAFGKHLDRIKARGPGDVPTEHET
jgi:hypothetical protein